MGRKIFGGCKKWQRLSQFSKCRLGEVNNLLRTQEGVDPKT
jgi:hypothetical protein